jgi:hypothetical protein
VSFSLTTLTKINQAHGLYRRSISIFHYYVPSCQRGFAGTARLCGLLALRWLRWPRCPAVLRWLRCGERLVADIAGRFHNIHLSLSHHQSYLSDGQRDCKHTPVLALLACEVEGCGACGEQGDGRRESTSPPRKRKYIPRRAYI